MTLMAQVFAALERHGLLLQQDKTLPNVVTLLTGESLKGSWWSHPKGKLIFKVLSELADHADVVFTKLLSGKVTLVHRKLWPALLTVACTREPWQTRGLSPAGGRLLKALDESGEPIRASGPAVKELERRLLAHTEEVHTETGKHEIVVEPWPFWAKRVGVKPLRSVSGALEQLEQVAKALGVPRSALPW